MNRALLALTLFGFITPAYAQINIVPTYDATITANPTVVSTLNTAIAEYAARLNNPGVTVRISFQNTNSGLGSSATNGIVATYSQYRTALISHATTADDVLVNSFLPAGGSPIPAANNGSVTLTNANARALGLLGNSINQDATIMLNLSVMNFDRITINPAKYDHKGVAQHEIDEVLGTPSGVGNTNPWAADYTRFASAGVFSHSTNTLASAYLSFDGGVTNQVNYNQRNGNSGDYGDFMVSVPARVQDWAGTPGSTPNLGLELRLLDVIGYNLVTVPEPATLALIGLLAVGGLGVWWYHRKRLKSVMDQVL